MSILQRRKWYDPDKCYNSDIDVIRQVIVNVLQVEKWFSKYTRGSKHWSANATNASNVCILEWMNGYCHLNVTELYTFESFVMQWINEITDSD